VCQGEEHRGKILRRGGAVGSNDGLLEATMASSPWSKNS